MKAFVLSGSLRDALRKCMSKSTSSPRFIIKGADVMVTSGTQKPIRIEGLPQEPGWGYLEYDRAERVIKLLDIFPDRWLTFSYDGRRFVFTDLTF